MFIFAGFLFWKIHFDWWLFPTLLLAPDISMVGYLINNRIGAYLYNIVHHKGLALVIYLAGFILVIPIVELAGIILFAHSSLDRLLGYGLKHIKSFQDTHLGKIG